MIVLYSSCGIVGTLLTYLYNKKVVDDRAKAMPKNNIRISSCWASEILLEGSVKLASIKAKGNNVNNAVSIIAVDKGRLPVICHCWHLRSLENLTIIAVGPCPSAVGVVYYMSRKRERGA